MVRVWVTGDSTGDSAGDSKGDSKGDSAGDSAGDSDNYFSKVNSKLPRHLGSTSGYSRHLTGGWGCGGGSGRR